MSEPANRRRAVALRYRQDQESAPRVLARGSGDVADRIIALAREHGIPLHEEVPPTLYLVLAEVLAHVYRANRASASPPPR